jgi:hypothetical protein
MPAALRKPLTWIKPHELYVNTDRTTDFLLRLEPSPDLARAIPPEAKLSCLVEILHESGSFVIRQAGSRHSPVSHYHRHVTMLEATSSAGFRAPICAHRVSEAGGRGVILLHVGLAWGGTLVAEGCERFPIWAKGERHQDGRVTWREMEFTPRSATVRPVRSSRRSSAKHSDHNKFL